VILALVSANAFAATYKGKSVDGVSYGCTIKMDREIFPCSVEFDGKSATVKFRKDFFYVRLASEIIDNPADIEGYLGEQSIVLDVDLPE